MAAKRSSPTAGMTIRRLASCPHGVYPTSATATSRWCTRQRPSTSALLRRAHAGQDSSTCLGSTRPTGRKSTAGSQLKRQKQNGELQSDATNLAAPARFSASHCAIPACDLNQVSQRSSPSRRNDGPISGHVFRRDDWKVDERIEITRNVECSIRIGRKTVLGVKRPYPMHRLGATRLRGSRGTGARRLYDFT